MRVSILKLPIQCLQGGYYISLGAIKVFSLGLDHSNLATTLKNQTVLKTKKRRGANDSRD